jgi:hypothetical protein
MKFAIALMKLLALGEKDVRKGRTVEQEVMFKRLEKKLKTRKQRNAIRVGAATLSPIARKKV